MHSVDYDFIVNMLRSSVNLPVRKLTGVTSVVVAGGLVRFAKMLK